MSETKELEIIKKCPCCGEEKNITYPGYTLARCKTCGLKMCYYNAEEQDCMLDGKTKYWCIPISEFTNQFFLMVPKEGFMEFISEEIEAEGKIGKEKVIVPKQRKKKTKRTPIPQKSK